ncbi:MAG: hypothetical protein KJ002_08365, partial [Candidatus Dadabacteria bacterium]|nr:hypothetical protein [Candidatus Dadabacteria bacterium]
GAGQADDRRTFRTCVMNFRHVRLAVVTICNYTIFMANITIRNISQSVFDKLKLISRREKRSLNNEILRVIELGLSKIEADTGAASSPISKETQLAIWRDLSGKWSDRRSAKTIIREIYEARTPGREVEL